MSKNSTIIFSKNVPLDKGYKDVVNYSSSKMLEYLRRPAYFVAESNNYSFIKKEEKRIIRTSLSFAQAQTVNYIAFRNDDYYAKWYFAFVTGVEFVSPACTEISFVIDEWSTWFDQFEQKNCFVIREHVSSDNIGEHTVDEGLAVSQVTAIEDSIEDNELRLNFYIAVTSNWNPSSKTGYNGITAYTKCVFGSQVFLFNLDEDGIYNLEHFLFIVGGQGHIEDIHEMFIIPQILVPSENYTTETASDLIAGIEVASTYKVVRYDTTKAFQSINKFYNIDKPKTGFGVLNNKCYCYPYNYLLVSNGVGSENIYRYEDFADVNTADFQLQMALSVGVSARVVPVNYKGLSENIEESVELGKYPTCAWSSDAYTNWLTQQAVNVSQRILGADVTSAIGKVGEVASKLLPQQIAGAIGSFSKHQLLPEVTEGSATSDVNFASNSQGFRFMRMRAKPEIMRQIDNFFSRFGYKILRVKIPNMTGRLNWNYVEIGEGEIWIEGEIPASSKEIINNIARSGVTVWHDLNNVGNFNIDNHIV